MKDISKIVSHRKIRFIIFAIILISIGIIINFVLAEQIVSYDESNENAILDSSISSDYTDMESLFTLEEKEYISKRPVIKAANVDGAAPLSFTNKDGQLQGIFHNLLLRISSLTGLTFECSIYQSVAEAIHSDADIVCGISPNFAPDSMMLSQPFLETETILYMNSSVDSSQLNDKVYAAVKGSRLPEGVNKENAVYFNTREESMNAVESGNADYGYGNAYSVTYYMLRNGYRNIITVPIGVDSKGYCIGLINDDEVLLSIINKALDSIDTNQRQTLILGVAAKIDRKITFNMVLETYGREIAIIVSIVLSALLFSVFYSIRISNKYREQNGRYEALARISNEYLYEYFPKGECLKLADKFYELFHTPKSINRVTSVLKSILSSQPNDRMNEIIRLPLPGGEIGVFKTINLNIKDHRGRTECIIGKLIDVREETVEKEKLLVKAQIDGLTGLFNAATTQDLINERVEQKENHQTDAMILLDCDGFKNVNDKYGHLAGNKVLEDIAGIIKKTFRGSDILGRIGGDEFCVYLKDIPFVDFVQDRCKRLSDMIQNKIQKDITVSMGIVLVRDKEPYESLFRKADTALYQAKRMGKARFVIYNQR
ncbi:MAG TPA: GGDEF domain-containing protein [Clostridiales bacterium]|nr:GGDEF domain-containing protein [Clostridiales bacterium]